MTPTVFYVRKSTDMQENSIESQIDVLTNYAKSHDMVVIEQYIDKGISGRTAEKRKDFMRMIEDSAAREFEVVLVYDNSRFARNLEESLVYKSVLKRNGVRLVSITEPTSDDDSALITDAMLGALNEMYVRNLSKSVKRGIAYAAQNGKHLSAPPYGYLVQDKHIVIVPSEAENVKTAFEMFAGGKSYYSIAKRFNSLEIKRRNGSQWLGRDVFRMLNLAFYAGKIFHLGNTYKGVHEPIIDEELWNRVQFKLTAGSTGTRPSGTYAHWLSGIMYCGCCGQKLVHSRNRCSEFYRCKAYLSGCKHPAVISVGKVVPLLKEALIEFVFNENTSLYAAIVRKNPVDDDINALKKALMSIDKRIERHKSAYSAGVDTLEEYSKNKKHCIDEKNDLEIRLKALVCKTEMKIDRTKIKDSVAELLRYLFYTEASIEDKNTKLKSVIDKIIIDKETGELKVFYFY